MPKAAPSAWTSLGWAGRFQRLGSSLTYLLKAVRHQRIAISDQVGGNVECLTLRLPWYSVLGWGAIACHLRHVLFRICLCILAFRLNEKGCWRTSILCTHVHEFLYIYIYFIYLFYCISNIWFCMLDVIIGRYTLNCQIRTHIHSEIHTHTHAQKQKNEK